MTIHTSIEEKIGKVEHYQINQIESFSNRIFLHKAIKSDGSTYMFIEKTFLSEQDYPQKKRVESQISRFLSNNGVLVPKIICEDDSRIVYEYIESKSINPETVQKVIVNYVGLIHSRTQCSDSQINHSIPWRNSDIRISQIHNWIDLLNQAGSKMHLNEDKITSALNSRDSKQDKYTLTLRDCGVHNAIYDGTNIHLIDFERACYGHPADDIASLIVEEINPTEDILRLYFESIKINTKLLRDTDFNFELTSSLFEKSLEILVYFLTRKGDINEAKRKSILNKYSYLVDKYKTELIAR